ncbi:hypothetical protein MO973_32150 [Paenibacillus sp. TRM 82003]|uniref:DUF6758 family protein n=1 Tax=Kineococcus sp. TRM81007 TaxID=2925831 RepID=UPI001F5A9A62|nr:DUF6758 family protein [Kineococcus sp. TRM81007]MCI2239191.1 hypothetical protein [Kineococcus sp. TRM81007]MCI3924870.1 hypothetical protein [Paenibacillus sp. TRM 82003]
MSGTARCPRCDGAVRAPSIWHSSATCAVHGAVVPLQPACPADAVHLQWVARHSEVPVWLPWPLPDGWLLTGTRCVRDDRCDAQAVVVAVSGPHRGAPGDPPVAELLLVAEQPGTGLGAHLAGREDVDPGEGLVSGPPAARPHAGGAAAPLWPVPADSDRAVLVGEAGGVWLWALLWPASAGATLLEDLELIDLREREPVPDVPCGAMSPRVQWA